MFGRQQLKQGHEFNIVFFVGISKWFFVLSKIEIGTFNFIFDIGYDRRRNFFVKKVCRSSRKTSVFKILKLLDQFFILGKILFKNAGIKDKPFVNIDRKSVV